MAQALYEKFSAAEMDVEVRCTLQGFVHAWVHVAGEDYDHQGRRVQQLAPYDCVPAHDLQALADRYGIEEEQFLSDLEQARGIVADAWVVATMHQEVQVQFHDRWSVYQEKSAQVGDGFIRWVEDKDAAYVTDIQAGQKIRGRALLSWLSGCAEKQLYAVGVVADAEEFWGRMEAVGLICGQYAEDFMTFFGRGQRSEIERS